MDGDGCIFSQEHLCQGQAGGFAAAQRLSAGIMDYLRRSQERIPPGSRLLITLYLSMAGIESVLLGNVRVIRRSLAPGI
jgi:hypothetical protein